MNAEHEDAESAAAHLREDAATLREDAATLREIAGPFPSPGLKRAGLALILAGAAFSAIGLFTDGGLDRLGYGYLLGFAFIWAIVLGSLFFTALHHLTHAVWSVVIRRVAEMFAAPMAIVGVLFVPVLLFAFLHDSFSLFPWANPDVVAGDHILQGKRPYLNTIFFSVRGIAFFLIWIALAAFFVKNSIRQDDGGGADLTRRMRKVSAPFMIVFALTVTFASFDWMMSMEPHWFSTIYGVYVFGGMTAAALAAITIAVVWLRARGRLGEGVVRDEHLYSLGALIFAFTCFWAYIAFSQFMLIWYGNMPEETVYFIHRIEHGWLGVSLALVAVRFVVPFFLLLSRDSKMCPKRLVAASVIVLAGEYLDLYWLIMPQVHADGPRLGWHELGPTLLLAGVLLLYLARFLARHRTMAVGDPFFEDSRRFHL